MELTIKISSLFSVGSTVDKVRKSGAKVGHLMAEIKGFGCIGTTLGYK